MLLKTNLTLIVLFTIITSISSCANNPIKPKISTSTLELISKLKQATIEKKKDLIKKLTKAYESEIVKRELMLLFRETNKEIREEALKAIQTIVAREDVKINIKHAKNKKIIKRFYAIRAFKFTSHKLYNEFKIYDLLINALDDEDKNVAKAAAEIIAVWREKRAVKRLAAFFLDKRYQDKLTFEKVLIKIGKDAVPYLTKIITDEKWESATKNIVRTLYNIKIPVAYRIMQRFTYATSLAKVEILNLLSKVDNEPNLDIILADFFNNENSKFIKREILKTFRRSKATIRSSSLAILLPHINDSDYKSELEYLIGFKGKNITNDIISYIETTNYENKKSAVNILFHLSNALPTIKLINLAKKSEENKNILIPYLANLYDPKLLTFFINTATSGSSQNKKHSIKYLEAFIEKDVSLNTLKTLAINDSDVEINLMALKAIYKNKKDIHILIETYKKQKNIDVKRTALRLLGQLHSKEAIPYLIDDLSMESTFSQTNSSALALIKIGKPAIPQLLNFLSTNKLPHTAYACWILAKIGDQKVLTHIKKYSENIPDSGIYILTRSKDSNTYALEYKDVIKHSLALLEASKKKQKIN